MDVPCEAAIDETALAVLDVIPTPVSIFDRHTLRFLAVNEAAAQDLGRDAGDLLEMSVADLSTPEAVRALQDAVAAIPGPVADVGKWRLMRGDGGFIELSMRWRGVSFRGSSAVLATWRDISLNPESGEDRGRIGQERSVDPDRAEATARLYRALFESAPGKFLVITPETHEIVAASDAFLEVTNTERKDIVGQRIFDVFPDDPDEPLANGMQNIRASFRRVEQNRAPDVMAVQRHPIPRPASKGGGFEERFWLQVNAPVLDPDARLAYIIQRVEDVTELARIGLDETLRPLEKSRRDLIRDVLLRSQELGQANLLLEEHAARLKAAERLLNLGTWNYDRQADRLDLSERLRDIYGLPADATALDFEGYLALVHPEDRDRMRAQYLAFAESGDREITFRHRILRADGSVVHLRGVGEHHVGDGHDRNVGVAQDITEYVAAMERLSQATGLMRLAGERAKLGGWRVDLDPDRVHWTEETAAIHEEPADRQPSLEEAMSYYTPESRGVMAERFESCGRRGEGFDEVVEIVTAKENRIWVRAMGDPVRDRQGRIVAVQGAIQDITEIVETREKFAAVSRQLRETLENMGDAFFMIDHDWKFSFVNRQAGILLERRPEDLIGNGIWEEFPEAGETIVREHYERVMRERTAARFELFYPPLAKWFRIAAHPAPDGFAVYFNDISEQRAGEEQLRLLEAAISHINDAVLIAEAGTADAPAPLHVVYVNDAVERLSGYGRDEIFGETPRILEALQADGDDLGCIRSALERSEPVRSEVVSHAGDGSTYWLDLDIVPLKDDGGRNSHFVAVARDITERKRTSEAIRVRDERFRLLSRASNDVIWDWDLATDRFWWNETLTSLFGHERDAIEAGSDSWKTRVHPEDRDRVMRNVREVLDGSASNWTEEYRFFRADGTPRLVVDRGFVIRDAAGKAVRMLGSMMDVTDQRELEARYRQSQKLEAVGQLTGGVAHDFNNLLTVILGNCEMLAEGIADPDQRSMAEMAVSAAERGAQLTGRLLAFSRRQPLDPRHLDLNRCLEDMEGLLRRTLREDIELHFTCASGLHAVDADPAQLESAVLNLVLNARDAMPDGGRLTIETANAVFDEDYAMRQSEVGPGAYAMISVTDSGTGMPPEIASRVFEPFFTTKDVGIGSGLGLSMVYGFVKQSGGHVSVYSEPGYGTTVKIYLPRSRDEAETYEAEPQGDAVHGGTEKVLVVEDDALVRKHLVSVLIGLGYDVRSAEDGPHALEMLLRQDKRFDLLVTDVIMPGGMNGRELAEAAKAAIPDLRILFTSGYTEDAIVHQGRLDAGVHLLVKPYRRQELAEKMRQVLDETRGP